MSDVALRFLSRADVIACGGDDIERAVEDVEASFALLQDGEATMPPETSVPLSGSVSARAYALAASLGGGYRAAGLKWVAYGQRQDESLPAALSLTLVNDGASGRPLACLESGLLTAVRTAAVSALVLRTVAPAPVQTVALLGTGLLARVHLRMLLEVARGIEEVRVWGRRALEAERLVALAAGSGGPVVGRADTLADALDGADAVLTCTSSETPFVDETVVRPGRLLLQIGYHEVTFEAIDGFDHVLVDAWGEFRLSSAKSLFQMHRAGRFARSRLAADLQAVLHRGWRPAPGASVYFSSFGLNVFDISLAARVAATAAERGVGTIVSMSGNPGGHWSC